MTTRGRRVRVARGIYRDRHGLQAEVKVGSGETALRGSKRYPPDTPLREIQTWQKTTRHTLESARGTNRRGTLEKDAERYAGLIRETFASWRERRSEVRAWVRLYGSLRRSALQREHVQAARARWAQAGVAPKTINHRVYALKHLYQTLDGRQAMTPCDDVTPFRVPARPKVSVSADLVRQVHDRLQQFEHRHRDARTGRMRRPRLRTAKTRARFMLCATTGRRPAEVQRAKPDDVDLERRVWVPRDHKGGRTQGIFLNDEMLAAWQLFIEAKAWGAFRTGSFDRTLRAAGWPKGLRPYQLRHTVGMLASEQGADLADIAAHLGHRRIQTTREAYVPVLGSRLERFSRALDHRFGWARPSETAVRPVSDSEDEPS